MNDKKGQAALEFLMTYGWAILVVLVAIGALAFFGVLSPDKFLPSKCTLQPGLACVEHQVTDTQATLVIKNGYGSDITITNVAVEGCGDASPVGATLANGAQNTYSVTCGASLGAGGSKFSGSVNITYLNADSGLTRKNIGNIVTKVE